MKTKIEPFSAKNPDPILNVSREIDDIELGEVIDIHSIEPFMKDFYTLVQIPIGISDLKGDVLARVGWQDICTRFHRVHPETCRYCIESNINLSVGISRGEYRLYRCKNNIWDAVTPITVGSCHVGNFFVGQFFFDDEPPDYALFQSQARKYGFNEEEYIAALEKVPRLSRGVVDTVMSFFMKFADMLSRLIYSNVKLAKSLSERDTLLKAHRESEEKYRNIVETANEGVWIFNSVSKTTYVNDKMAEMLGYSREEMIGSFIWDYADKEYKEFTQVKFANRKQGIDEVYELRLIRKGGSYVWLLVSVKAIFDMNGKFAGSLGMYTDITEHKQAEQALQESEERFRSAFNDSAVAMALVSSDAHLLKVNDAFCRMLGFEESEMKSLTFLDFTYPDDIEPSILAHKAVINSEKPSLWIEKRYIRKDGQVIWCEVSSSPVLDSKGHPIYTVAHIQDITERKKMEEALKKANDTLEEQVKERTAELERAYNSLKESEEKYRSIVETANEGISIIDNKAIIIFANRKMANMLGYTPEEGIGRPIWDFLEEEYKDIVKLNIEKRLPGTNDSNEMRLICKDGSRIWVLINSKALFDNHGMYIGMVSLLTDTTKRKEAERALANIDIARKKEIHHRIKNNLQVISSLLDLQADKFKNKKDIKDSDVLEAFKESQDRVISIALIHEELHKGDKLDTLDFSSYIEELANNLFLTYSLGDISISLNMNLEESIIFDMDTAVPLGMIINELVSNSFKHAFAGRKEGEIQIKLYREENGEYKKRIKEDYSTTFILSISDNGIGIPENLNIEDHGTLGMQLVTSLVDQLDGELILKRDNGTEFIIMFTLTEKSNQASTPVT